MPGKIVYNLSSTISRGGAVAARVAHNHEVPGSSPGPATKENDSPIGGSFSLVRIPGREPDAQSVALPQVRHSEVTHRNYLLVSSMAERRRREGADVLAPLPK